MSFALNTLNSLCGVPPPPPPETHARCTSQWLMPHEEWRMLNIVSSNYKAQPQQFQPPVISFHRAPKRKAVTSMPRDARRGSVREPIWKRRGAKPVPLLKLHPVIRGDITWEDKSFGAEDLLDIVSDNEWQTLQPNYFEVHSNTDIQEGVVIDPPSYPAWFAVPSITATIPALLPRGSDVLLQNALNQGFSLDTLVGSMGTIVCDYSMALIHPKRRSYQEVLILARQKSWQGAAAIAAATLLLRNSILVSVFITDDRDLNHGLGSKEEDEFIDAGGAVYRDLQDLTGRKFRVVVVAVEDQYSASKSSLSLYGEWLQHAVAIFVDPPILKCSYTTALQIATKGCYNMCQKTIVLMPFLPKPFMKDNFVELLVVDGGISEYTQRTSGVTHTIFPRVNGSRVEGVVPVDFTLKGSRLYFYRDGKRVPC